MTYSLFSPGKSVKALIEIYRMINALPDDGYCRTKAVVALFMMVRGGRLAETTWSNSIDAFPWLSVGVTYLPIPLSGVVLLLFIIERVAIGPPEASDPATAAFE